MVCISDLSGQDIPEGEQVEVRVLELDGLSQPVRLDASQTEADRLRIEARPLALLELLLPDGSIERVALDAEQFKKAIKGDADEVMASAEALSFPSAQPEPQTRQRGRRQRSESAASGSGAKLDYTAPENAGIMHRGRVTEAEAEWVRNNLDEANANRARVGQSAIDPNDEKEKKRYGF